MKKAEKNKRSAARFLVPILRWTCLSALALFAVIALLIIAAPVWFPWLVQPLAGNFGLGYARYERIGYSRFALHDVGIKEDNFSLSVGKAEAYLPPAWFVKIITGNVEETDFISVENWHLSVRTPKTPKRKEPAKFFPCDGFMDMDKTLSHLVHWLPRAGFYNGLININGNEIHFPEFQLHHGLVRAIAGKKIFGQKLNLHLEGNLRDPSNIDLQSTLYPYGAVLNMNLVSRENLLLVGGNVQWQNNVLNFSADFEQGEQMPAVASIQSEDIDLSGKDLLLEPYERIKGSVSASWQKETYNVDFDVQAYPGIKEKYLPFISAKMQAHGDLQKAVLQKLNVESPSGKAFLDSPLELDYEGTILSKKPVGFEIDVDLEGLPFPEAGGNLRNVFLIEKGKVTNPVIHFTLDAENPQIFGFAGEDFSGEGTFNWRDEGLFDEEQNDFLLPHVDFNASAANIIAQGHKIKGIHVQGIFKRPVIEIKTLDTQLIGGTQFSSQLAYNFENKTVEHGEITGNITAPPFEKHLPGDIDFEAGNVDVKFSGPLQGINYQSDIALRSLSAKNIIPGNLTLNLSGRSLNFERWTLHWENEKNAELKAEGGLFTTPEAGELNMQKFTLEHDQVMLMELIEPFQLKASYGNGKMMLPEGNWELSMTPLHLNSPGGHVKTDQANLTPETGSLSVDIRAFQSPFLEKIIETDIPDITVENLNFKSSWEDYGALFFDLNALITAQVAEEKRITLKTAIASAEDIFRLDQFDLSDEEGKILSMEGFLPASINPSQPNDFFQIDAQGELQANILNHPQASFWRDLESIAGIRLESPELIAEFRGSLNDPVCSVFLDIENLSYEPGPDLKTLAMDDIQMEFMIDQDMAALEKLSLAVEGHEINALASLPMGKDAWENMIRERKLPDWKDINARIFAENAELDFLAEQFPHLLSSGGNLSFDIEFEDGRFRDGYLVLQEASTRPIGPLESFRDISLDVKFEDFRASLKELSTRYGGEKIIANGFAELGDEMKPHFELNLHGNNIPILRRPGLVVRSDLDISCRGSEPDTAKITGVITMRESAAVSDWRALTPQLSVTRPEQRPPFFSVDTPPFSDWELDLNILGEEFLSVRAPGFRGNCSMDMNLQGTLLEPYSVGDVQVESGMVRFPFASLNIDHGMLTITEDEPFTPRLSFMASARTYGYDIKMNLYGTAYEPILEFSSHPPLSSQAILLMLTAGELPRDETVFSGRQKATKLAFFIVQNLFADFGGNGDLAQRVEVRTGENISEQGRETYHVEFMLLPKLGLVGEYDRFDAFNFGVKWRFYVR